MTEIQILTMDDIASTALHNRGNAAVLSELADQFIRKMNSMLGGQDSTEDYSRHKDGFVPVTEIPDIDGLDAEERMLDRLEEKGRELRILEHEQLPDDEADEDDEADWPLFVGGVPLDEYLALSEHEFAMERTQDALEAADRTVRSYAPTSKTVRRKAERLREKADAIAARLWSWWTKSGAIVKREEMYALYGQANGLYVRSTIMAKGERSDARDRRLRERGERLDRDRRAERLFVGALRERFLTEHVQTAAEEVVEDERFEEIWFFLAADLDDATDLDHWVEISDVVYRHLDREFFASFGLQETADFYAFGCHVLDIAGHCWLAGMGVDETDRLIGELIPALLPKPAPAAEIESRHWDPIDGVWSDGKGGMPPLAGKRDFLSQAHLPPEPGEVVSDEEADFLLQFYGVGHDDGDIDPPRESGEFGRAGALLDDDFDDVPPSILKVARKRDEEDAEERTRRRKYAAN